MGRIVITEYISVDGVVEAPSGTEDFARVGWVDDFRRGPEGDDFKVAETMASDALLLGRATYDGFAPVWPQVEGAFADKFNTMPKYVVSSTLEDPEWDNTRVLRGDVIDGGRQAQGAVRRRHRRPRQPTACADTDRTRPGRRVAADGLPDHRRRREAPLRPDQRHEASATRRDENGRRRDPHPHLPAGIEVGRPRQAHGRDTLRSARIRLRISPAPRQSSGR